MGEEAVKVSAIGRNGDRTSAQDVFGNAGSLGKRHLQSDTDTACAAETGWRQTSAQTWAIGKARPALA